MSAVPAVRIIPVNPPPAPLLRVFVPGSPPSANHMYSARGFGAARYLTAEARAWREAVALSVMPWRFPLDAPRPILGVSFVWVGCRSDIDNPVKLTLDGVKDGLLVDDKYVEELRVVKRRITSCAERGAWIEVRELPSEPEPTTKQAQRAPRKARNKAVRSA